MVTTGFPPKLFNPPPHQRRVFNPAMTAKPEGFKTLRRLAGAIGLFRQFAQLPQGRRADAQQPTHFAGAINRPPLYLLGFKQGV